MSDEPYPPHTLAADLDVLRPTRALIDLAQIAANYRAICAHTGRLVMPVLKANAYGHGLVPVGRLMEQIGAPVLGLAFVEEAIALRRAGVQIPILVLGGILGDQIPLFLEHDLWLTASSVDKLLAIDEAAGALKVRAGVHLKIDTGMERLGVHWYSAEKLLAASLSCKNIDVRGIFSHLASSDDEDGSYTALQRERFEEVLSFYERRSLQPPARHLANSGGVLQHPETWYDLVRPGILLYGIYPAPLPRSIPVAPALTWTSKVVYLK